MGPIQYLLKSTEKGSIDFSRVKIKPTYQSAAAKKKKKINNFLHKFCLDPQIIVDSKVLKFQVLKIRSKTELHLKVRINSHQPNGLTALYYCCGRN